MGKRTKILGGIGFAGLGFCAAALAGAFAFDVRIPQERIREMVASKLPLERQSGPLRWRADEALVTVLPDGRVGIASRLHVEIMRRQAEVRVDASAVLVYRDGAFWLDALEAKELRVALDGRTPGAAENLAEAQSDAASSRGRLRDRLGEVGAAAASRMRDSAMNGRLGAAVDRAADAAEDAVKANAVPVLGAVLHAVPVYRMESSGEWRVRMGAVALTGVTTDGSSIVATLDPAKSAVTYVIVIVLALAFAIALLVAVLGAAGPLSGLAAFMIAN